MKSFRCLLAAVVATCALSGGIVVASTPTPAAAATISQQGVFICGGSGHAWIVPPKVASSAWGGGLWYYPEVYFWDRNLRFLKSETGDLMYAPNTFGGWPEYGYPWIDYRAGVPNPYQDHTYQFDFQGVIAVKDWVWDTARPGWTWTWSVYYGQPGNFLCAT